MWTRHDKQRRGRDSITSAADCPAFSTPWTVVRLIVAFGAMQSAISGAPVIWNAPTSTMVSLSLLDKATDDFNLAVGLYRSGRWQLAADTFRQFLEEAPEHPRHSLGLLYYGLSLSSLERYADARPQFTEFLKREGESAQAADARYRLGECSYYLKDYDQAVTELNEYLTRHPEHSLADWATLFLGDSYNGLGKWEQAEPILSKLVSKPPAPQILRDSEFALARCLESLNRPDEAIEIYRSISRDQQSTVAPRALAKIGTLHFNRRQYAEASSAYDEIVTRFAGSAIASSAQLNSGLALYRFGSFEEAIKRFQAVEAGSTNSAQAIFMMALSMKELGQVEEARQSFINALAVSGNNSLAADILFQRAQLERVDDKPAVAAQIFEDIADRWPKDQRVSECLFNAADLRLEMGDVASAEKLWQRLQKDYPNQAVQLREQVLLARLFLNQKNPERAIQTLQRVVSQPDEGSNARVLAVGRYYLIRALFDAERYTEVIDETRQIQEVLKLDGMSDLRSALALGAISGLQAKDYAATQQFADQFIPVTADKNQKADVLSARTVALAQLKQFAPAMQDAQVLAAEYSERSQSWSAILQAADVATREQAYPEAAGLFELVAEQSADESLREAGMTGVAWSHFRHQSYAEAETAFARLYQAYPQSRDAAQAVYMQARCAEELKDTERAAVSYQAVFRRLTEGQSPAAEGLEVKPPMQYAYDAGRQAARMLGRLRQTEQADRQWEQLVSQFPAARDLDRVLDEWAALNLNAERYERSDQIHRQLLDRFPDSPFSGPARLSLAESEMQAQRLDVALQEFEAIVAEPKYAATEKERALFHVIDIYTARREWTKVRQLSNSFLMLYSDSQLLPQVRLLAAEAVLNTAADDTDVASARSLLDVLREDVVSGNVPAEEWTERIWIVLAETALAAKDYSRIDEVTDELTSRNSASRFQFQLWDIQGRRWKNQAPPDFSRSREYFSKVLTDPTGQGTETAARCQFMIAETLVLEKNYQEALKEYLRTYINYPYEIWQVQALYQAAGCEAQLNLNDAAVKSYRELVSRFPESEYAARAKVRLKDLGSSVP